MCREDTKGGVDTYELLIFRPSPNGPDESLGVYVLEPCVLHPSFQIQARTRLDIRLARYSNEFIVELFAGRIFFQRAVRRDPVDIQVDELDPAAGLGMPGTNWRKFRCVESGVLTRSIADAALANHE